MPTDSEGGEHEEGYYRKKRRNILYKLTEKSNTVITRVNTLLSVACG